MKKIGVMNKHINDKIELPVSFRVFGIGDKTQSILDEINSWDYPGVKTLIWPEEEIIPSEEDEMVIFINPDNYDINALSKSFYDADILTLLVVSEGFKEANGCYDAFSITKGSDTIHTIFGILYPLFHRGYISFDYYDILQLMKNQVKYKVLIGKSKTWDMKKLDSLMNHFEEAEKQCGILENIAIIFSFNQKTYQSITTVDLCIVQETTRTLPETINIKCSIVIDEKIKENQIQMITIFSGKNLKF